MTDTAGRGEWCLARSCGVGASVERSDGGVPRDPVTGWIPAFGDLCIISFLPLQGEVPEGGGGTAPPSAIWYLGQEDPLSRSATAPPARGSKLIQRPPFAGMAEGGGARV